jgi:hypothetical protein
LETFFNGQDGFCLLHAARRTSLSSCLTTARATLATRLVFATGADHKQGQAGNDHTGHKGR